MQGILYIATLQNAAFAHTVTGGNQFALTDDCGLIYKSTPQEVRPSLLTRKVELNIYNGMPHLRCLYKDQTKQQVRLHGSKEMERRYELIESVGVRIFRTITK